MLQGIEEYLLISNQALQRQSVCLMDYKSSANVKSYCNGGLTLSKSLHQIGNDYILTAEQSKPIIHIWPLNSQEPLKNAKHILPGPANCLAISSDNNYMAVAINTKLYIWQLTSGVLLSVSEDNLLKVNCLKFSTNSDYLLTASANGMVICYNFGHLIDLNKSYLVPNNMWKVKPLYILNAHICSITDLYVGSFGLKGRFVTVSLDNTLKIYNIKDGSNLLHLIYDQQLTAVTASNCFLKLYVGTKSGKIYLYNLTSPPRTLNEHVDMTKTQTLTGHDKKINCLNVNYTGKMLASGSDDFTIIIWDLTTCDVFRRFEDKGFITDLMFVIKTDNMFAQNFEPLHTIKKLQRTISEEPSVHISVLHTEDIEFEDEESSKSLAQHINSLQEKIMNKTICNVVLYNHLLSSIKP